MQKPGVVPHRCYSLAGLLGRSLSLAVCKNLSLLQLANLVGAGAWGHGCVWPRLGLSTAAKHGQQDVITLCKENRINEAFELYMQHPGPVGPSALIAALGRQRDLVRAFEVYNVLVATSGGSRPNVAVINALAGACRRCGQPGACSATAG